MLFLPLHGSLRAYCSNKNDDGGKDIPEEEAVCRICFIELGEGSDTLKMECSCKLAFAHRVTLRDSRAQVTQHRIWQDVPILVIVRMLACFYFLEQLLVGKMKSSAIAISLPFSCILGLLASMTVTTMELHMQPVIVVLVSMFAGFGITMSGTSVLAEVLWRRRWLARSRQQSVTWESTQPDQLSTITRQTPTDSLHHEAAIRDLERTRT